jgi:hypothetical protein
VGRIHTHDQHLTPIYAKNKAQAVSCWSTLPKKKPPVDGPPEIAEKYLSEAGDEPAPVEGRITAVLLAWDELELWVAEDECFDPGDHRGIFYRAELPLLDGQTPATLRWTHGVKLIFGPGTMVRE